MALAQIAVFVYENQANRSPILPAGKLQLLLL